MYPFVCGIQYWDEIDHAERTRYNLLYAENFAEASSAVETYYGMENVISLNLHCIGEADMFFDVPEDIATALVKGGGIYEDGLIKEE